MIKIGLTGNIASGKSTVEKIAESLGYKVYDLDIVSHKLLENKCKDAVLKQFKTIVRSELAKIVFSDKNKLIKLENILHPELKKFISEKFEENKDEKAIFISGALILEKGFKDFFDKVIFVDADYNLRLERLMKRNNYTLETAKIRMNAQNDELKNQADYIIENNSDIKALEENTLRLIKEII